MSLTNTIKTTLTTRLRGKNILGPDEAIVEMRSIGAGCVSDAFVCTTNTGTKIFVKTCAPLRDQSMDEVLTMFESEAAGLKALDDTHTIRVPTPYDFGELESEECGYLATEYIDMRGKFSNDIQQKLGSRLADLHLTQGPDQFGFPVNNTIGSTPQDNTWMSDWVEFLHRRLKYQFELASNYTQVKEAGQQLLDRLPTYFEGIEEPIRPSLQHGDLWSGNWSADENGDPVIYDPAPFWGHSEFDLGMMKLFGDVDHSFYKAYHAKIPKAPGYHKRISIYALYHAVNHLNMFGSSYLGRCMSLFKEIL